MCDTEIWYVMSDHCSARSHPNPVTRTENPDKLPHRPNMINNRSYQTVHLSRKTLVEETRTISWSTQESKSVDRGEMDKNENELIDNEILDIYGLHEEPSTAPTWDYISSWEVEKFMKKHQRSCWSRQKSHSHVVSGRNESRHIHCWI